MLFEWPFSCSWGQHGSKFLPKWCPGGWRYCSLFLGLEGLGGVLGPLGAQELILIHFWLIFGGFWLIFGRFLDDFSMIFDRFLIDLGGFLERFSEVLLRLSSRVLAGVLPPAGQIFEK